METEQNQYDGTCVFCKRKTDGFCHLKNDELDFLSQHKTTIEYEKGETIIKQGTRFSDVVSFNSGLAKIILETNNEKKLILNLIKPSEILGGPGMFADNKYAFSVVALQPSIICLLDVKAVKKVLHANSQFAEAFFSSFSYRFIDTFKRFISLTHKQMHGRLAETLIHLADDIFQTDEFDMYLSRQDLAEYTGMTKESVSRIMHDLVNDSIIDLKGSYVKILNKERLKKIDRAG